MMGNGAKLCFVFFVVIISGSWANFSDCVTPKQISLGYLSNICNGNGHVLVIGTFSGYLPDEVCCVGSAIGSITSVTVTDCDNTDAQCILHRNTNVTITIVFVPSEDVETITAVVHGIILGVEIPFEIPNPDGCKDSGLTCPLNKGESYTYETSFPVLQKYPRVSVGVKFELKNKNSDDITCSLIPSKIQ